MDVMIQAMPASTHVVHFGSSRSHRSLRARQVSQASPGSCRGGFTLERESLRDMALEGMESSMSTEKIVSMFGLLTSFT
jgi:hypothetical protein